MTTCDVYPAVDRGVPLPVFRVGIPGVGDVASLLPLGVLVFVVSFFYIWGQRGGVARSLLIFDF